MWSITPESKMALPVRRCHEQIWSCPLMPPDACGRKTQDEQLWIMSVETWMWMLPGRSVVTQVVRIV